MTDRNPINANDLVLVEIAPADSGPLAQAGCCNYPIREHEEAREWGPHPGNATRGAYKSGKKERR
jgi:hypothetical protein